MTPSPVMPVAPLPELDARHALRQVVTAAGPQRYRRAGSGPVLVLLHGIGSASGSWLRQLDALKTRRTVLAWDAPGYGDSAPVAPARPAPADYGARVWAWLDALDAGAGPLTLVGHSLGAIMAAAAVAQRPAAVGRLVLLSPARGYATAEPAERERRRDERLQNLRNLGAEGMARRRVAAMLSPTASDADRDWVRTLMAQVRPEGYAQATHLLADSDLARALEGLRTPAVVASGAADAITPPAACEALARGAGLPYRSLGAVGHVCALEAADAVNRLLAEDKETQGDKS